MTELEIFKKAISSVIAQGEQSINSKGSCQYRTFNDKGDVLKCAVGHLISDENYREDLEGKTLHDDIVSSALEKSIGFTIGENVIETLRDIQISHDVSMRGPEFVKSLVYLLWECENESINKALEELGYERKV